MLVPMFVSEDEDSAEITDRDMQRNQAAQMERLSRNPNISTAEYEALNAKAGNPGGLPPRPSNSKELEKRLEAEKAGR